jgi:hypothetical protein
MKIYQAVQKLLVGDTQIDRQTADFNKPTFIFGKWAKNNLKVIECKSVGWIELDKDKDEWRDVVNTK